jgi:hypothetical protein
VDIQTYISHTVHRVFLSFGVVTVPHSNRSLL